MQHPLEFIPQYVRKPVFYFFLFLTLLIFGIFRVLDQPLRTSAAPNGIVSFELARTVQTSESIVDSWDSNARLFAAFGLGLDYLFMPVYALALSLGSLLAGDGTAAWYRKLAVWLGWAAFAAAIFDAIENYALWKLLIGEAGSSFSQIAAACASVKFTLLLSGLIVSLLGVFMKNKREQR
jgi:hypothetical protein